jgi:hypothetical protein
MTTMWLTLLSCDVGAELPAPVTTSATTASPASAITAFFIDISP